MKAILWARRTWAFAGGTAPVALRLTGSRGGAGVLAMVSMCPWLLVGACSRESTAPEASSEPDTVVDSIWVEPSARTIGVLGTRFEVGAAALAADGTILYGSALDPGRFSLSSSALEIATIDEETHPVTGHYFMVTGVSEGTATITATSQGLSSSMTVTVQDRARLAWSVPIPGGIEAGNVMGADGTLYVGTNDYFTDRSRWYAVSPQGGIRWTLDLPLTGRTIPATGADGTLYLGSRTNRPYAGRLIAVNPAGIVRWMLPTDLDGILSAPALGPDGTIYAAGGRHVYAVDPQGDIQWTYEAADELPPNFSSIFEFSSPAIASDGTIYVGGTDGLLYAINPDGSLKWTFKTGNYIFASPSIGRDGTIYFGSMDGRLYAVNSDGTVRWSMELDRPGHGVKGSPSIGPDGTIYAIGLSLVAIDPSGWIRWSYPMSRSGAAPILGADGTIYIASQRILAFGADGELLWDYQTGGSAGGSPVIGLDGTVVAAASDELVAIVEKGSTNGGFAGAPWPQVRGDRANSGRAGG